MLRYPVGYVAGQKYPTVFEIYETFFDNGFNARAAFLASHGYAVFHPSVNLVVGRPGEVVGQGRDDGRQQADRDGRRRSGSARRARHELRRVRDGAAPHADGSLQGGDQHFGQGRHGQLLHRQPAPGRAEHARAREEPGSDRRHAVGIPRAVSRALRGAAGRSDQDAAPQRSRGDQDPNVPSSQSREIYYALRRLGREVEWVRYVNGAHRPPNSAAEAVDFEQRILAWYDKYLRQRRRTAPDWRGNEVRRVVGRFGL